MKNLGSSMNVSISNPKGLNSPSGFSAKHGTKDREGPELARVTTPDALIPVTDELIRQAEQAGCGARFAGAGIIDCTVDPRGVR